VGAVKKLFSFAEPRSQFISTLAEQPAVVPPFDPVQVQCHGPFPVTAEAVPALQRSDCGAESKLSPFAEPHAPFTFSFAEQLAVEPSFNPAHVQFHGPVPVSTEAVPAAQSFDVGSERKLFPFAEPQAPFTLRFAMHCAVVPFFDPAQVQVQGPLPVTTETLPELQRFDVGVFRKLSPFAEPHSPSRLAEQLTEVPPFAPAHVQVHGPVPLKDETSPALQRRFDVGVVKNPSPFAEPQAPLTSTLAEQFAVAPPFDPAHVQTQEPDPLLVTVEGVPELQRLDAGALRKFSPFAEPQTPLTRTVTAMVLDIPVIDEFTVSVAVMVWFPVVYKVAENVPEPLVSVVSAGSFADPSVLVKCTVPK